MSAPDVRGIRLVPFQQRPGWWAAVVVSALLLLVGVGTCVPTADQPVRDHSCQEDEPCWDCETMGNGACGP